MWHRREACKGLLQPLLSRLAGKFGPGSSWYGCVVRMRDCLCRGVIQAHWSGLAHPRAPAGYVIKVLLQQGCERGAMCLIVVATSQDDLGNKIVGTVLMSQIRSDEVFRPGGASLPSVGAVFGEQSKEEA